MKRTDLMLGLYILVPIIFLIIPIPLFFAGYFDDAKSGNCIVYIV